VVGGLGIGLGYSATTPPCIKWFPLSRKGLITGIVVSGVGLAAVYISPLTEYLLKQTTIPRTFIVLGIGATVLVTLLSQWVADPPREYAPFSAGGDVPDPLSKPAPLAQADRDWHEMLRTGRFYQLWLMFVLAASAGLMLIAHIAIIGKEQAGLQWGFLPIAMLAAFNTCGRLVAGFVSDRIGRTNTMLLAFVLQAANMLAFTQYTTPALLIFGSAFTGLCYGTFFTLMPAATADFYGLRNLGVNYGIVFTAFGVAGVIGPTLGGRIRDLSGSYAISFQISGIMLLVGAVMAFFMRSTSTTAGRH
jgi:OFA family oxalate/formate antiporter-like MFS transporter